MFTLLPNSYKTKQNKTKNCRSIKESIEVLVFSVPAASAFPVGLHMNPVEGVLGSIVLKDTDAA
jgi:hypothetical protein